MDGIADFLKGATGSHFAIFEDGGPESFLDVADAVDVVSWYVRDEREGERAG